MKFLSVFISLCLLLACNKKKGEFMVNNNGANQVGLTYLALGDSYTIGEAVPQGESFPHQLVSKLNSGSPLNFGVPKIIARTGWTTAELQQAIRSETNLLPTYSMVTLLIGVNNQYRGQSAIVYRDEFRALLKTAISFAGGDQKKVFVVSIPDWGVTPFGKNSGRGQQAVADEIDLFNAINKEETLAMNVSYTDITAHSRVAATDLSLVAQDGLHPSGKMYAFWTNALFPSILENFKVKAK